MLSYMQYYVYIFKFSDQSIHMVLRYSLFTVITGIITYIIEGSKNPNENFIRTV